MTNETAAGPSTGVVITGGGSGIGAATMHALARSGRPVAAWDLDGDKAERVAAEVAKAYGVPTVGLRVDVRDTGSFATAIKETRTTLGTIGGLVHGAGVSDKSPIDELDEDVWHRTIDVHLTAAAVLIRDLTPDLLENRRSSVVLIASIASIVGFDTNPAYCAAKSGMLGLVRTSASRLGPRGIRVNAICPGFIDTPMMATAMNAGRERYAERAPLRRVGRPEDIAAAARFLLSDEAAFITAAELVVDGGATRSVW